MNWKPNLLTVKIAPGIAIHVDLEAYAIYVFETVDVDKRGDMSVITLRFKNEFRMDRVSRQAREPVPVMTMDNSTMASFVGERVRETLFEAQKAYLDRAAA